MDWSLDNYTWQWAVLILAIVVTELRTILNTQRGDTLSSHVQRWFEAKDHGGVWSWKRIFLLGFMTWLTVHFVWDV